ncbi:MAG: tetratricopeptide repeat protein [Blautia wexlerae]
MNSAIKLNPENGSYYRDYAITEAYCGDTQKAQKLLDEAEEKGSSTADIEYVKGEIQYSAGAYSEAHRRSLWIVSRQVRIPTFRCGLTLWRRNV